MKTLALSEWMSNRLPVHRRERIKRPRVRQIQLSELTELVVKQCQNRLYYSKVMHRYVSRVEIGQWFDAGKLLTVYAKDGADITVPVILRIIAQRVEDGSLLTIARDELRKLGKSA
jgi:polyhydroxyalkanoate synthesis regulator protein